MNGKVRMLDVRINEAGEDELHSFASITVRAFRRVP